MSESVETDVFIPPGGEPPQPPHRDSVWELIYGVLATPKKTMEGIGEQKPLLAALILAVVPYFFALVVEILSGSFRDLGPLPEEVGGMMTALVPAFGALGGILVLGLWFVKAGIYQLIGQFMGGDSNGPGLLAALGFAAVPQLFLPPAQLLVELMGGGWGLHLVVALAIWLWTAGLEVLAIRGALALPLSRAVWNYLVPWLFALFFILMMVILFGIAILPIFSSLMEIPFS